MTVTGQRSGHSASAAVVGRRILSAAPHRDGSELLLTVPGVFVSQHGGEGKAHQIFFRGFDAQHGQDVELWAGGAPVNDVSNIHGQGYADLHFLIPEVVREIRSTPGICDPTQGDFAVAGTMRFSLGYAEPGVTAKAGFGSFGARRYLLAYHPEGAPEASFGAVEVAATDGFGPSRAARRASGIAQAELELGKVRARLLATAYAGSFDSAGVLRLSDVESGQVSRFATYDSKQGGFSSRSQLVLELSREWLDDDKPTSFSLAPFVVLRSLALRSNFTGFLEDRKEGDSTEQRNDALTLGATASFRRPVRLLSKHDSVVAGLSLRSDGIEQSQHRLSLIDDRVTDTAMQPGVDAKVRATDAAGYVDLSLHPVRRVTLRGGLRLDGLSFLTEDSGGESQGQARAALGAQLSKRGSLDVVVLPGLNAIGSYGEGFRSPQARSLGDGETTPFTRVTSYELGLRYRPDARFQASIAGYRTLLSDDLVLDQSTARNELVPGTRRTGVSASILAEPNAWFVSSSSFTYTHAAFRSDDAEHAAGELLPYVPQLVVRSDAAFTPRLGRYGGHDLLARLGTGLTYLGRRPLPYAQLGHDVLLIDAAVSMRFGPVETGLDVFNLLGADWYDGEFVYASAFGSAPSLVPTRHVTVGPPRSFFWSFTLYV